MPPDSLLRLRRTSDAAKVNFEARLGGMNDRRWSIGIVFGFMSAPGPQETHAKEYVFASLGLLSSSRFDGKPERM